MPISDDISTLYDQFGGNPDTFHELARAQRAGEARARWPLFSRLTPENCTVLPSAMPHPVALSTPSTPPHAPSAQLCTAATPPKSLAARLQQSPEEVAAPTRTALGNPSVWRSAQHTEAASSATDIDDSSASASISQPDSLPKPQAQMREALRPQPPTLPVDTLARKSAAVSEAPFAANASPLRRLVRAEAPLTRDDVDSTSPAPEELAAIFSRLARQSGAVRAR